MINEESKAYKKYKEFHSLSYFVQKDGYKSLYNDINGKKIEIPSIAFKDFGKTKYLSWIEEHNSDNYLLNVLRLEPHRELILKWYLTPQDGFCIFWEQKWSDEALFLIYHDEKTNYAAKVIFEEKPTALNLNVIELAEKIVIKKDWTIGFQKYSQNHTVDLFDLKAFKLKETISVEEAIKRELVPDEQNIYGEEME